MYGFGDDPHPRNDTVELLEDMVTEYLTDILLQAGKASRLHGSKLRTDDLLFALRKDPKKHARVEELLFMNEELKKARKAFEMEEEGNMGGGD